MTDLSRQERFFAGLPDAAQDMRDFANTYFALAGDETVPSLESFFDNPPITLLPRVVIADIEDAENFTVRFFGTAVVTLIGRDPTGMTAAQTRSKGLGGRYAHVSWASVTHPCGYLSRRLIYRQKAPGVKEAAFDLLTLALPARRRNGIHTLIQFHSSPHLAASQDLPMQDSVGIKVLPLSWLDIGAGVPGKAIDLL
jgi:hypothetical protein